MSASMQTPALEFAEVLADDAGRVLVHAGGRLHQIAGLPAEVVIELLTALHSAGSRDAAVEALAHRYERGDVEVVLDRLVECLARERPRSTPGLGSLRVAGVRSGRLGAELFAELGAHLRLVRESTELALPVRAGDRPELSLVILDGCPLRDALALTDALLAAEREALFVSCTGDEVVLGPLMIPGRTPCLMCGLARYYFPERPHEAVGLLDQLTLPVWPVDGALAQRLTLVGAIAAALDAYADDRAPEPATALTVVDRRGRVRRQAIGPMTRCPHCRGLARTISTIAGSTIAGSTTATTSELERAGGSRSTEVVDVLTGLRSVPPSVARALAERALAKLGAELDIRHARGPADLIARHPALAEIEFVKVSATLPFRRDPRLCSGDEPRGLGKGLSADQAWCSAVYEWFEESFARRVGPLDLVRGPADALGVPTLDLDFFCAGQVPQVQPRGRVPRPADAMLDWVEAVDLADFADFADLADLADHRPIWLPAASAHGLARADFAGSEFVLPERGSSGIAAGTAWNEAVLEGLLEVVEHDASFAAAATGLGFAAVELDSVDDVHAHAVLEALDAAGYEIQLRDLTNDIGVPVVEAAVRARDDHVNYWATGLGCHLSPVLALRRALTEAFQGLCYDAIIDRGDPLRSRGSVLNSYEHRARVWGRIEGSRRLAELPRSPWWNPSCRLAPEFSARARSRNAAVPGVLQVSATLPSAKRPSEAARGVPPRAPSSPWCNASRARSQNAAVVGPPRAASSLPDTAAPGNTIDRCIGVVVQRILAASPRTQACAFAYPVPPGLGVHVVSVVVTGMFDALPHPVHVPDRVLDYRARLGRVGGRFTIADLRLGRMPP
ncbi:AknN [Enhygromyxa salina]|uniref:AknN n=1 Tax=Enhygromyxa salina TaxID=215803 RepID=A0A0C2DCK3_9BACT|nr:AknN [Enhygromyxa salina]